MNLKPALRYQASEMRSALSWYYGTVFVLGVVGYVLARYLTSRFGMDSLEINISGLIGVTPFFLFVVGLNSYKPNLFLLLQNGVSRKTLFVSLCIAGVVVGIGTGIIDLLLDEVIRRLMAPMEINIMNVSDAIAPPSSFPLLGRVVGVTILNGSTFFAGVLITSLFYRLNTLQKVLVPVGLVLGVTGLSFYDSYTGVITKLLEMVESFSQANLPQYLITQVGYAALILGVTWLLQRRAQVKTNLS